MLYITLLPVDHDLTCSETVATFVVLLKIAGALVFVIH